ncbi:hypothetical protein CVS40_12757 [Lucilia cuprina]|nr:hypothetical protein CVS40_12757 [Lucilia cuprina]
MYICIACMLIVTSIKGTSAATSATLLLMAILATPEEHSDAPPIKTKSKPLCAMFFQIFDIHLLTLSIVLSNDDARSSSEVICKLQRVRAFSSNISLHLRTASLFDESS